MSNFEPTVLISPGAITTIRLALERAAEYFDVLADIEQPAGAPRPIPNAEMCLLLEIEDALQIIKELSRLCP